MRKIFYFTAMLCCSALITSCANKAKTTEDTATYSPEFIDEHTAELSLDYYGEYQGTTPAADCPGIKQTLILNRDQTFTLHMVYIDRPDGDFTESGTFKVEKNTAILTAQNGTTSYYKVEEGRLVILTADREPITGELASHYVLKQEKVY